MDVIQQLPFPDEICRKILLYACESPHTGLGVSILKRNLQTVVLDIPENDEDIIMIDSYAITNYPHHISIDIYLGLHFAAQA